MKSFLFKEERLLKLRKQQVSIVELEVAKAARTVECSTNTVEMLVTNINDLNQQICTLGYEARMHASQLIVGVRAQLEAAHRELVEAQSIFAAAVETLHQANRSVESLSTLETRGKQMHAREIQKQEQAQIDSISALKWVEKKGKTHV